MPFLLKTHYRLAKSSIKHHRARSFFTCLGIAIGVACITLILSLIGSIDSLLSTSKSSSDSLIVVRPHSSLTEVDEVINSLAGTTSFSSTLTHADIDIIRSLDNISYVAPISISSYTLSTSEDSFANTPILATTSDFIEIENLSISTGTFITSSSPDNAIILGHSLASKIYGNPTKAIGHSITIMGKKFITVGVLSPEHNPINYNNIDLDNSAIVNLSHFSTLNTTPIISQIDILVKETSLLSNTRNLIQSALDSAKSEPGTALVLLGSELTSSTSSLLTIVSSILSIIAIISLFIGGIGIMNIMLVVVTERTHEIGIKKSVGATNLNILSEFLMESTLLSFGGGLLGIFLGYLLALLISFITPFGLYFSWTIFGISLGTSVLAGIIFGFIPAFKAAKKDPIRSLKTYY